ELRVRRVVDQRDRFRDLVVELARQAVVGALGEGGHLLEQRRLFLVVVNVEVRCVVDLPVELLVLDLVLAERSRVLARHRRRGQDESRGGYGDTGPANWVVAAQEGLPSRISRSAARGSRQPSSARRR